MLWEDRWVVIDINNLDRHYNLSPLARVAVSGTHSKLISLLLLIVECILDSDQT